MSRPGESAPGGLRRRVDLDDEQFARDIGLMLRSGLTLMDSLKTLRERASTGTAQVLDALTARLQQGESLSQALQSTAAFRPALLACVKASELTGGLGESLDRYARNAARLRELRARIVSALLYPALLVLVAGGVVVFLLVYVVPRFALVLETSGRELPALSSVLIAFGRTLNAMPSGVGLLALLLLAWGVAAVVQSSRQGQLERELVDVAARLPAVRDLVRRFGQSQFTRSSAMLVKAGVPVIKALVMCRDLLSGPDRERLDRAVAVTSTGAPLAAALRDHGLVDAMGLRVLRVAEQTGAVDQALERLAEVQEQELERTLDRVGRLVEPVLMLGIGLVVGGIVVLMYLPIFQLAASL